MSAQTPLPEFEELSNEEYSDDDASSEDEEEPRLKYQRLGGSLPEILSTDNASCLYPHEKFLVLGTHLGMVHVLDANGFEIMKLSVHTKAVNGISMDGTGDSIATCGDDGRVVITNLFTREQSAHEFGKPVLSLALSQQYAEDSTFLCGGMAAELVSSSRGWFGRDNAVIHSGEGPVWAVAWKGSLIAWANDLGVKMYDIKTKERLTFINRSNKKGGPPPGAYPCNLTFANETTLLIGWADSVKIAVVKPRLVRGRVEPVRYVQIVAMFQTDFIVAGIAPMNEFLVYFVGCIPPNTENISVVRCS
jgi:WD40 repeat protein